MTLDNQKLEPVEKDTTSSSSLARCGTPTLKHSMVSSFGSCLARNLFQSNPLLSIFDQNLLNTRRVASIERLITQSKNNNECQF